MPRDREFRAKEKRFQKMTHDGLIERGAESGEEIRISTRERDFDLRQARALSLIHIYRKNVEYGSARWGTKADIAPYMDPKPENNIILTQTEGLMMSGRPKNPAHARNKNVLVVGGSGSGDNEKQYPKCANGYCFRRLNQNRL